MNHASDAGGGFADGVCGTHPRSSGLPQRERESGFALAKKIALRPLTWTILAAIAFYQFALRPLLPSCCIYTPGCSAYFMEAVRRHGPILGSALGVRRLCRCHPWGRGGIDPVP